MKDKCDKIKGGDRKEDKEKKDKVKKDKDKGKQKKSSAAHPTMLSTLLSKRSNVEYTMVAGVIDNVKKDDLVLATHSVNELACLVEDAGTRGVLDCGRHGNNAIWFHRQNFQVYTGSSLNAVQIHPL